MKNTNYFQHDHNSRGDEKILKMRLIHGWEGFGIYWAIVEKLYESTEGILEKNYKLIAYDLQVSGEIIKDIIENFGLFETNKDFFYHKRVKEHNQFRQHQSESGRKGGLKSSGSIGQAVLEQPSSHKGKKGKKERKERNIGGEHFLLEIPSFKTAFNDFLDMRKAKKKPATDRAKALILKDLEKHPINTAILMLEQSIKNSWTDVYPLKDNTQETKKPNYDEWEKKANKSCTNCRGTGKVYAPGSGQYGKCGCVK